MKTLHIDKTSKDSIIESFDLVAENLILNSLIVINESVFSMIDIEFFYWHSMHPDDFARGIKHLKPCGEFEIHRYGIDLSLGNQDNIDFGGILIRGIYDIKKKKVIKKSEDSEYITLCNICHRIVHETQLIPYFNEHGDIYQFMKPCWKCGGQRYFNCYKHRDNGICYACNGHGYQIDY